jgi:excisionase family DNA binding protein
VGIYTTREVATRLKISSSQVYALVHAGRLRCLRLTTKKQGGLRFTEQQIMAFLAASEQGSRAPAGLRPS